MKSPRKPGSSKSGAAKTYTGKFGAGKTRPGKPVAVKNVAVKIGAAGEAVVKEGGSRDFAVRLKNARSWKHSSQIWLQRQLNDPYVIKAKREGYRSRAAFKFLEIDDKFRLLKPGQRIVDLGAAPGGWSQIAAARVGSVDGTVFGKSTGKPKGRVIGIDLLDIEPIAGVEFTVMDFNDEDAPGRLKTMLGGLADGVLSDMAANTTGHKQTDHLKIVGLAELAVEFACQVLEQGGFFAVKLFQGGESSELVTKLKREFKTVRHVKPAASRADSSELYVLATGFRGAGANLDQDAAVSDQIDTK